MISATMSLVPGVLSADLLRIVTGLWTIRLFLGLHERRLCQAMCYAMSWLLGRAALDSQRVAAPMFLV